MMSQKPRHPSGSVDATGAPIGGRWKRTAPDLLIIDKIDMSDVTGTEDSAAREARSNWKAVYAKMQALQHSMPQRIQDTQTRLLNAYREWSRQEDNQSIILQMISNSFPGLWCLDFRSAVKDSYLYEEWEALERSSPEKLAENVLKEWADTDDYDGPVSWKHCKILLDNIPADDQSVFMAPDGTRIASLRTKSSRAWNRRLANDPMFACSVLNVLYSDCMMMRKIKGIREPETRFQTSLKLWLKAGLYKPTREAMDAAYTRISVAKDYLEKCRTSEWHDCLSDEEVDEYCQAFEEAYDAGVPEADEGAMLYSLLVSKR